MAKIVVRKFSAETYQALRVRAKQHGRSTEAEIRAILDQAVRSPMRARMGTALANIAKPFGGVELETARGKTPAQPARFR